MEVPDDAAAAQVMSNNTQAWSKNHDPRSCGCHALPVHALRQTWRQHLLAKQQPVLVEAPAEEGGAEVSAYDGSDME